MIVSRACPIEFWINGVPTFNDKINPGVQQVQYQQRFQLSDEIRIQVLDPDDEGIDLAIAVYDCNGIRVALQDFTHYDGYYETTFTFSTLGLSEGSYRVQIETPFVLEMGVGVFSLNGQDATLGGQFGLTALWGSFTLTGRIVTFELRTPILNTQGELYTAYGSTMRINFGPGIHDAIILIGNGASDASAVDYASSLDVSVTKTTGGGTAGDYTTIVYYKNGLEVHRVNINLGDPINGGVTSYTFTGLSANDTLDIQIFEG